MALSGTQGTVSFLGNSPLLTGSFSDLDTAAIIDASRAVKSIPTARPQPNLSHTPPPTPPSHNPHPPLTHLPPALPHPPRPPAPPPPPPPPPPHPPPPPPPPP